MTSDRCRFVNTHKLPIIRPKAIRRECLGLKLEQKVVFMGSIRPSSLKAYLSMRHSSFKTSSTCGGCHSQSTRSQRPSRILE